MSDRDDLHEVQGFLAELIAKLQTASAREGTDDAAGGLFPTGINDIFAKLTVGGVTVELEVSAANAIHAPAPAPAPPSVLWSPQGPKKAVRPMSVTILKPIPLPGQPAPPPAEVELQFVVKIGNEVNNYGPTPVPSGTTVFDLSTGQIIP